ncbi:MAG: DUF6580 family putative transport protein [Chitinophagales bacterium]
MKNKWIYFFLISAIVIFGFAARLIPHFPNFAPMGAIALFAGAFYKRKYLALAIPLLAWWLSDLYLNNFVYEFYDKFTWFTWDQLASAISLFIIVLLSANLLKKQSASRVLLGSVSASLIFFVISNFGVWAQGILYPMNLSGLLSSYLMAIPFYKASFLSDMIFSTLFFGSMYLINKTATANSLEESLAK